MKNPARPGGQALGATSLPVKDLVLLLAERPRTTTELARELNLNSAVVERAVENLLGLNLIDVATTGEGDVVALTDLGREVAQQQRGG